MYVILDAHTSVLIENCFAVFVTGNDQVGFVYFQHATNDDATIGHKTANLQAAEQLKAKIDEGMRLGLSVLDPAKLEL